MRIRANSALPFILMLIFSSLASFCFAAKAGEPSGPITVKTEVNPVRKFLSSGVNKNAITIGDKIKYTIIIVKDKNIEVQPVEFGKDLGSFAIKDFGTTKNNFFGKEKISQWYLLDTYTTGKTEIPKVAIRYRKKGAIDWKEIEAGVQAIEVKSVLDKPGADVQMRDIKGPVGLPSIFNKRILLTALILAAALGVLALYFMKKKKAESEIPQKPAHRIAYEALEALLKKDYIRQGKIKEYYIEISDIIRHYLENRFKIKAAEMTTEEFLIYARDLAQIAADHRALLREFLICCDLVKFAKYSPTEDEVNLVLDSAKKFIDQTREEIDLPRPS